MYQSQAVQEDFNRDISGLKINELLPENVALREQHILEAITEKMLDLSGNDWHEKEGGIRFDLLDAGDSHLKRLAKSEARKTKQIYEAALSEHMGDIDLAYVDVFIYLTKKRITPPDSKTTYSAANRAICSKWWLRRLRVKQAREMETEALEKNQVSNFKQIYASNKSVTRREAQRERNARVLENVTAVNELGQEYTLYDLAALSVSNPEIRRAELMTRIKGFEQYAKNWGDVAEFYTITCPSKMHAALSHSKKNKTFGRRNPKYDGTDPRAAQKYLSNQFRKIRAKLDRNGVEYYGFRVVEPQHDGTPHWHLLLFMSPESVGFVRSVFKHYALEMDGDEKGADLHRFKAEKIKEGINPETGQEYSAAGYIAKYISKAIDGFGVGEDLFGNDAAAAAKRIETWASTWGIRQFQQIGGASVTVWRELRRLRDDEVNGSELIERARQCANSGDWSGYCHLNWSGNIKLMKKELPEGENALNVYGDEKQMAVLGIESNGYGVVTRPHVWEIGGNAASEAHEVCEPWTRVNNCTEELLESEFTRFLKGFESNHSGEVSGLIANGFNAVDAIQAVKGRAISQAIDERLGKGWDFSEGFTEKMQLKFAGEVGFSELMDEYEESGGHNFDLDGSGFEKFKEYRFNQWLGDYLYQRYGIYLSE